MMWLVWFDLEVILQCIAENLRTGKVIYLLGIAPYVTGKKMLQFVGYHEYVLRFHFRILLSYKTFPPAKD